jgi:leucyl aminopeptidase
MKYGEIVSYLPILDEALDVIKSDRADVKNTAYPDGDNGNSFVFPAVFLDYFVPKDVPFIFWDISHMCQSVDGVLEPGATGYGLRIMVQYIRKLANISVE